MVRCNKLGDLNMREELGRSSSACSVVAPHTLNVACTGTDIAICDMSDKNRKKGSRIRKLHGEKNAQLWISLG